MTRRSDPWGYLPTTRAELQRCFECGEETTGRHHVVPVSLGGTKVIPLCTKCHNTVHSCSSIQPELIKQGLKRAKQRGVRLGAPRISDSKVQQIVNLRKAGRSYKDIARLVGVSVGTAHAIAQ